MRKRNTIINALSICLVLFYWTGCQTNQASWVDVLAACKQENKYTILFVDDGKNDEAKSIGEILDETAHEHSDRVKVVRVNYEKEKDSILGRFKLQRFKGLPATLIVAPNGALIGLFGKEIDEAAIERSFVSPKEADLILSLQEGQAVFLCLYDNETGELDSVKSELNSIETYFKTKLTRSSS